MPPDRIALDPVRWEGLWHRLGGQGDSHPAFEQLAAAYGEPSRAYHTVRHIVDCLREFDWSRGLATHPDEVEAALWLHDVVYLPGASENEEQSADLAEAVLARAAVSPEVIRRIRELVLATRHTTIPQQADAQLLCDIDLSILGREGAAFAEFERQIRKEYAWVPEPIYRNSRSQLLAGLLLRPFIYQTRAFRDRYEARARINLKQAVSALSS